MEKVKYDNFPERIEVFKEENLFFLHCALCGIDLLTVESKPPHVTTQNILRNTATGHNRDKHFPKLKEVKGT